MNDANRVALEKIKFYSLQVLEFKQGLNFEEFSNDAKTISACVFNLSQIGELARKIDASHVEISTIPWHKIKGMRNRIVHDYEGIKLNIVWDVIEDFLPQLINEIDNFTS